MLIVLVAVVIYNIITPNKAEARWEDISALRIPYDSFHELETLSNKYSLEFSELLTIYCQDYNFFPEKSAAPVPGEIEKEYILNYSKVKGRVEDKKTDEYEKMFRNILTELRTFPIPSDYSDDEYVFADSWGSARNYGADRKGSRIHEGTDILDRENIRGRLPIVSMTDGEIQNFGWNELGGFYVGITTVNETYYYYAHMDSFAPNLEKGMSIRAGDFLGYMGDTGYGKEGERGNFPVHLHIGICPKAEFTDKEFWINPYVFLRSLDEIEISESL
jgi:murein DD-endopeptidase MepM/ murein hydrolase activator NlpD